MTEEQRARLEEIDAEQPWGDWVILVEVDGEPLGVAESRVELFALTETVWNERAGSFQDDPSTRVTMEVDITWQEKP